jgi:tape measure domain-containing protein
MAEVDPVILEVVARVNRYEADLKRSTRTVDQQLGAQERRVKALENQFRSSSSAIALSLKGLAGTLATAFTGQQLVGLIDGFTRLQNSLRVAGLEGEGLAQVQERLLGLSGQYGVSIEELARLFGQSSQAASELGASQSELLQVTANSAAALKITGTSATEAQGALLGLVQAFASGTVRAEEFNQINEGGLRPLLQAAANTERFGGSVAQLRQAVLQGTVSSQEFFRSILSGSADLENKAASATLTLAGAITALESQLTVYVGSAASANGVTGALAGGIQLLAENVDVLIPALATVAAILTGRLAVGLAATAVQAAGLRVIALGLAVQLNGTAAAATLAGRSLLAAFGGPVGLAIGAIAIGLFAVANSARGAEAATGEYKRTLEDSRKATDSAREAAERLASAHGQTRAEALRAANAERELTKQKLAGARASLVQAQAELKKARAFQEGQNRASFGATGVAGTGAFIQGRGDTRVATARSNVDAASERIKNLEGAIATLDAAIAGTVTPAVAPVASGGGFAGSGGGGGAGRQGPDLAAIETRYRDELDQIRIRINQAEGERARTAQERAEFEGRQLELAEDVALRSLEADQDYTEAQKAIVRERLLALGEAERDNIAFRERAQLEREALDILDERGRAEIDGLRLQFDLADTEAERRALALRILEAEEALLRAKLEATIASETAAQADIERARIALAALNAQAPASREATSRQFEGPLARFARNTRDTDTLVEEAAVRRIEDLNQTITDAMTNALGVKDPFLSQLIKIFLDKNVFGPLAEALNNPNLQGNGGGIVAGIGSVLGSLFGGGGNTKSGGIAGLGKILSKGRASGGPVSAGEIYRVNEGASPGRVEAFVPNTNGQIIPLGRMNAVQSGGQQSGGVVKVIVEEAPGFAATVRAEAAGVAVEVVRQSAGQIIDAAANETLRRASRPSL